MPYTKKYILLLLLFISISSVAQQSSINNYKYVLVPTKFSFFKQENQYNLNLLTKILFEDKGFVSYFDDKDLPLEIANNKCNALDVDVVEKSSMFSLSLTIFLKDCKGNVVFKTKEGKSREKEYKVAYNLALRDAFSSFDDVPYAYNGTTHVQGIQTVVVPVVINSPTVQASVTDIKQPEGMLYAQPVQDGYQLINTVPKKVLTLLKTSVQDVFIANNETYNGLVLKKNGEWFFEYYKNDKLVAEKLLIKF